MKVKKASVDELSLNFSVMAFQTKPVEIKLLGVDIVLGLP